MNKLFYALALFLVAALAHAQEYAKVTAKTPIIETLPGKVTRLAGYRVTYEYAGKQYTTQMAEDPGLQMMVQVVPVSANTDSSAKVTSTTVTTTTLAPSAVVVTPPTSVSVPASPSVVYVTSPSPQYIYAAPPTYIYPNYYPYYYGGGFPVGINFGFHFGGGHRWR
ncbi:MAG: hypothetical protein IT497_03005 [Ottowia sp.]|nr:hypothetical protein [Ottowia sp.]